MSDVSLHIEGMTCGACVARVDRALHSVPGVKDAAVNLTTGLASVSGQADEKSLVEAVDHAGYKARVLAGHSAQTLKEVGEAGELHTQAVHRRLMLGLLFGVPAVAVDMAAMNKEWVTVHFPVNIHEGHYVLVAILSTLVMGLTGWPFFVGAWRAVRHFSANMDVLVALGAGVAYVQSVASLVMWWGKRANDNDLNLHGPMSEFHAAVTIVVLVTLGKYLEARAKRRAAAGVAGLAAGTAATAARVGTDDAIETVPAESIGVGERVQVLAHQSVPIDGDVVEGAGSADLSVITGESVPVEVKAGTHLPSGAVLADGRVIIRATATAGESTVARILDLVNSAQASKTDIQALADRVAGIFVPIILVLAALNFTAWLLAGGGWEKALITTIATIVIACPCAMGLATPTAITVAMGTAARAGILFTRANALERAGTITTVIFDKTGTLTEGRPTVGASALSRDAGIDIKTMLQLAASVEQFSEHPVANAIVAAAHGMQLLEPNAFSSTPGGGVRAAFADGKEYAVGSAAFLQSLGISTDVGPFIDALMAQGQSVVYLGEITHQKPLGLICLGDQLRPLAPPTVAALKNTGIHIAIISGDNEATVQGVAKTLGVDSFHGRIRPEEKAQIVAQIKSQKIPGTQRPQRVAFVGDGINDGPALAAADLGIAMASGTDLAKMAGDILLTGNRLTAIPEAIDLSRRTLRIIKQNLFWAFAYNVAAIPLAILGILPPGVAAAAMMLSSLSVVGNALRLHRSHKP